MLVRAHTEKVLLLLELQLIRSFVRHPRGVASAADVLELIFARGVGLVAVLALIAFGNGQRNASVALRKVLLVVVHFRDSALALVDVDLHNGDCLSREEEAPQKQRDARARGNAVGIFYRESHLVLTRKLECRKVGAKALLNSPVSLFVLSGQSDRERRLSRGVNKQRERRARLALCHGVHNKTRDLHILEIELIVELDTELLDL